MTSKRRHRRSPRPRGWRSEDIARAIVRRADRDPPPPRVPLLRLHGMLETMIVVTPLIILGDATDVVRSEVAASRDRFLSTFPAARKEVNRMARRTRVTKKAEKDAKKGVCKK